MEKNISYKMTRIGLLIIPLVVLTGILFAQISSSRQPGDSIVMPVVEYSADALKDPFVEYGKQQAPVSETAAPVKPLPAMSVQGIVWGGPVPQAIINGKVFKLGDNINEAKITGINKEGVELFYGGREYLLSSPANGGQTTGR